MSKEYERAEARFRRASEIADAARHAVEDAAREMTLVAARDREALAATVVAPTRATQGQ